VPVSGSTEVRSAEGGGGPVLYLVELRAAASAVGDVHQMHRALRHAVARQVAGGAPIRWSGAVLVPGEGRCLCLVEASAASAVDAAIDSAGLHAAPLRAYALADRVPVPVGATPRHRDASGPAGPRPGVAHTRGEH